MTIKNSGVQIMILQNLIFVHFFLVSGFDLLIFIDLYFLSLFLFNRTKLKQNEKECELLKKHLETLKNENKRLKKELQELKSVKVTVPFYVQLPATTLTVCTSCDRRSPKVE